MGASKVIPLHWPAGGIDRRNAVQWQEPYTCYHAQNVFNYAGGRNRGGSRPGMARAFTTDLANPINMLNSVTFIASGGTITTQLVASNGSIYYQSSDTAFTLAGGSALQASSLVQSAEYGGKLYIADHDLDPTGSAGTYRPKIWDPATVSVAYWTATDGTTPLGSTCVCVFRDRLILAGGTTSPYGVYGSRQGDPLDFDYSETDVGGAFSLALAEAGKIGDRVTAMWPHGDSCLIIGCPNSLWMIVGDPKYGGQVANISHNIGIVDRNAFCTTPDGAFVFLSHDGLYMIPAGCGVTEPIKLSREKMPEELLNLGISISGGPLISLVYDQYYGGIHIFLTARTDASSHTAPPLSWITLPTNAPTDEASLQNHFFLEWKTKAFWQVTFKTSRFQPWVSHSRKNYATSTSQVIYGCQDGRIRTYDPDNVVDDQGETTAAQITSAVVLGPFTDQTLYEDLRWDSLELFLTKESTEVRWSIHVGDTAQEAAKAATNGSKPAASGLIRGGRSFKSYPRIRGRAIYLRLSSEGQWAYEAGNALLTKVGRVRV